MSPESAPAHGTSVFSTQREDNWWAYPLTVFLILSGFVVYATFRVFENAYFHVDNGMYHYLSPFGTPDFTPYVPQFMKDLPLIGVYMAYPAFLVLPFPAGFRFTCYYYRKAYYRAFVARPAGCSVEAFKANYKGETRLLIFQNLHRYFLYAALIITVFLAYDALLSIFTPNGLYFGLGGVIMLLNVIFLSAYTLGCHSFRHLVGGKMDCFSCTSMSRTRHGIWEGVTKLNKKHGTWAMLSLFSVALTDLYIRWVGSTGATHIMGVIPV